MIEHKTDSAGDEKKSEREMIKKKNIYQLPPDRLMGFENQESTLNTLASELKSYFEAEKMLQQSSTKIEEVAGFVISLVHRAQKHFEQLAKKLQRKPRFLDNIISFLDDELDRISDDKKINLNDELYHVLASLRNKLNMINEMFERALNQPSSHLDKKLICDNFIKPLCDFLLSAKEWCATHQVEEYQASQNYSILRR